MSAPADPSVLLRSLRRRVAAQALVRDLGAGLLAAGGVLIVVVALRPEGAGRFVLPLAALGAFGALVFRMTRLPSLPAVARAADRAGGTRDRFASALGLSGETSWERAARAECAGWLGSRSFRALFPWCVPREWRWLPVVAIALGLLHWHAVLGRRSVAIARAAAEEKAAPTVLALQQLARKLPPQMKALAEQIDRRAEALRREPGTPAEAEKAALREVAALEAMVRELRQQPGAAERKTLQEDLAQQPLTRDAAAQLRAGDSAAAAKALEEAARKAAENPEAAAALEAALQRLAEQQKLPESLREASRQGAASALRRLAGLLRPSDGAPQGEPQAGQPSAKDLERLAAALENLQAGEPGKAGEQPPVAMAPGDPGPPIGQMPGDHGEQEGAAFTPSSATGRPGSEHDAGTSETPFGERQEPARKGAALALAGTAGPTGEVASQNLAAGTDAAKAKRQYKALYDAMAPAAEDAVLQEEIPLGSRLFLRRYFEAIRPRD